MNVKVLPGSIAELLDALLHEFGEVPPGAVLPCDNTALSYDERRQLMPHHKMLEADITVHARPGDWDKAYSLVPLCAAPFNGETLHVSVMALAIMAEFAAVQDGMCPECMAEMLLYYMTKRRDEVLAVDSRQPGPHPQEATTAAPITTPIDFI